MAFEIKLLQNQTNHPSYSLLVDIFAWEDSFKNSVPKDFFVTPELKLILLSNSKDEVENLIRFKYNDLNGDFKYIVQNEGELNDFIGKKMVLANNCPIVELTQQINVKLVELLVIANYDFKRISVVLYLSRMELGRHQVLFLLIQSEKIISKEEFQLFLVNPTNEYNFLRYLNKEVLIANLTERNIVHLTKHYTSIRLNNLERLLEVDNVEDVLAQMIISNKLPEGSKVDQLEEVLIVGGGDVVYGLNERILSMGGMVNEIVLKIA